MDLPFLNNPSEGMPAGQTGNYWGGQDPAGSGDDATLNDLLALYQTANDPMPVGFEPQAPSFEPQGLPFEAPAAPAAAQPPAFDAASLDPFASPSVDTEINDLIASFTSDPAFEAPAADPVFAAPPAAPVFAAPPVEPVFAAPPVEPVFAAPPVEPVFAAPPVEPVFAAPAPEPARVEPVYAPAPAPIVSIPQAPSVPAAIAVEANPFVPAMAPVAPSGAVRLATSADRNETLTHLVSAVNQLTTGIEQIQSQLATLYEGLAHAAATRAPVTEIITLTEQLTATKGQAGENSALFQQAQLLKEAADAYMHMLKNL
ncbi:MAG TPA: hypothetical protein V6D00_02655 [Pantanalinema sp.]